MGRRVSGLGTEELLMCLSVDMVLLASSGHDLKHTVGWFAKWLGCASAPLCRRPWFSAIKLNEKMKLEITSVENVRRYSD